MNKKAIELSLNFIIILIISIVLFGFGVQFITRLSTDAIDLQELTIDELDTKISDLVCEGSSRVCIGQDRKKIPRGEFHVFGIKVLNVLDATDLNTGTRDFIVEVNRSSAFRKDNSPIPTTSPQLIIRPEVRTITMKKNEATQIGVAVQVPPTAEDGTYILNVKIKRTDAGPSTPALYTSIQKLYVDVV